MQGLVYVFIALAALGVAAVAYFGLMFTPIEAFVVGIAFAAIAVMLLERTLRRRAEAQLEKSIEDLARMVAASTQANAALSQRLNTEADLNLGPRVEALEADLSVLGTVIRQVAESVADLEERQRLSVPVGKPVPVASHLDTMPEPVIPLEMLRHAVTDGRLVFHIEPIVTLPQRKAHGYDLVPRLLLEDGELADRADFMPRHGGEDVIGRIESLGLDEAIVVARRSRTSGSPITLYVPLSRASLSNAKAVEQMLATLDANRAIASALLFALPQADIRELTAKERASVAAIGKMGVGLSLSAASSLRFDFAELQGLGFRSARIDATRFLRQPESFTDFHAADIAAYARRFGIELIATGTIDAQQLLALFEDGIVLAQGPHIAAPGPVRPDLMLDRQSTMAPLRAEG